MRSKTINPDPFIPRSTAGNYLPPTPARGGGVGGPTLAPTATPPASPLEQQTARNVSGRTKARRRRRWARKEFHRIRLDLTQARAGEQHEISGTALQYMAAVSLPAGVEGLVEVQFDQDGGDALPMLPGAKAVGVPFTKILVTNAALASGVAYLVYTDVPPDEAEFSVG